MEQENRPFWQSATKIVFILLAVAMIAALFLGKVESKDFMYLVGQVFAFYFGQKQALAARYDSKRTDTRKKNENAAIAKKTETNNASRP